MNIPCTIGYYIERVFTMKYIAPVAEKLSIESINVLLSSTVVPCNPDCGDNNDTPIICDVD